MTESKMEMKEATRNLCAIREKLEMGILKDLDNPNNIDAEEAEKVVDMIKDMAEAEEKLAKKAYYCKITEAMEESEYGEDYDEEGPKMGRAGYRGRSTATGRYIHRGGYTPDHMRDGYPLMYDPVENYRMGYRDGQTESGSSNMNRTGSMDSRSYTMPSRHGMAYDQYKESRRYYTEHPEDGASKMKMTEKMDEAVNDMIDALKKMYMEADPANKKRVNQKLAKALQEMPAQ